MRKKQKISKNFRLVLLVILLILFVCSIILEYNDIQHQFVIFVKWFQINPLGGIISIIIVYPIATVVFFPTFLIQILFGYAFKHVYSNFFVVLFFGTLIIWFSASLGSLFALFLGRYVLAKAIRPYFVNKNYFKGLEKAIQEQGFKFMFLLRLSPVFPFNVLNYLMSLTSIRIIDFLMGGIGMFPTDMMYVYLGTSLKSISDLDQENKKSGPLKNIFLFFGIIIAIYAIYYISKLSKAKMDEIMAKTENQELINQDRFLQNIEIQQKL